MTRRDLVVGVIPKRRKDSEILGLYLERKDRKYWFQKKKRSRQPNNGVGMECRTGSIRKITGDKNSTSKENRKEGSKWRQRIHQKLEDMVEAEQKKKLTLLFGLRAKTISEWTFRLLSLPSIESLTALKAAANVCNLETSFVFQCQPPPIQDHVLASTR